MRRAMMRRHHVVAMGALVAVTLGACDRGAARDQAAAWQGTVDTLPGGALHVRNPAQGIWDSAATWRIVEELRIGSADSDGPDLFGGIADIAVDGEGRLYVLEEQTQEIRVFDRAGQHVRTVGRRGGGPREFDNATALRMRGDGTFWVVDVGNGRFALHDTSGAYLRAIRRELTSYSFPWSGWVDSTGDLAEVTLVRSRGSVVGRPVLIRFDSVGAITDTAALPTYTPRTWSVENTNGMLRMVTSIPFEPDLVLHPDPRGYIWWGVSDRYLFVQQHLNGDTVRIVEREATPRAVSSAELGKAIEGMDSFRKAGGTVRRSDIRDVHPLFGSAFVDDRGFLWVMPDVSEGEMSRRFDIFDPEGRYLGRATSDVPLGWRTPVFRGDTVYAVITDSLDVPYVVRARIERGPAR